MKSILATLFALMLAATVAQEPTAIDGGHTNATEEASTFDPAETQLEIAE